MTTVLVVDETTALHSDVLCELTVLWRDVSIALYPMDVGLGQMTCSGSWNVGGDDSMLVSSEDFKRHRVFLFTLLRSCDLP